jgi:multidrug efflux pump subunit AcrA (membrane-fusion protein)
LRAEARAAQKAQKELEAQQKRDDRVIRAEVRKAEEALKKAQREKDREAKKQLQTASKASQKRSRGRPPKQQGFKEPPTIVSRPINRVVLIPPKSRNGRTIKKRARFDGK